MNASHHSPLYSYFADATHFLFDDDLLSLSRYFIHTTKTFCLLFHVFKQKIGCVYLGPFVFLLFSTESSRPVDAPVCLLSVVGMETEPSHTNTQQQRIFFFKKGAFFYHIILLASGGA